MTGLKPACWIVAEPSDLRLLDCEDSRHPTAKPYQREQRYCPNNGCATTGVREVSPRGLWSVTSSNSSEGTTRETVGDPSRLETPKGRLHRARNVVATTVWLIFDTPTSQVHTQESVTRPARGFGS